MDVLTPAQRRRNMQAIKNKDTRIERLLGKALWANKVRYRKNVKNIFGKPDIVIRKYKIAIFCDSEFFHGKNWEIQQMKIKTNRDFWIKKISQNIKRDTIVNETLKNQGWTVLRFWGENIKKDCKNCVNKVLDAINVRMQSTTSERPM